MNTTNISADNIIACSAIGNTNNYLIASIITKAVDGSAEIKDTYLILLYVMCSVHLISGITPCMIWKLINPW